MSTIEVITAPLKGVAVFNYIDCIELPMDVVNLCYHIGDCTEDCKRCLALPEVKTELNKLNRDGLRKELKEYGAWSEDELDNHRDNLLRILWLASGNILDGE